ncbi:MAG: [FeFe] hydrogenase H-cluster radical SAM maturase HydG [Bacteroidales bacterium]|nr:[FeFe] hydrogenase H-cluster radical SAM maturase HydG [Bacteroidales bacterium]
MIFKPEKYSIPDKRIEPFIDPDEIWKYIHETTSDKVSVRAVIQKALDKQRLNLHETAILINAKEPELVEEIKEGARLLKEKVYGNRIVLFAPLYIGNKCSNDCSYCGFRVSNKDAIRHTLTDEEIIREVEALEDHGHKRLILVFGEHPEYHANYIAHTVKLVYSIKKGMGEIRRVNINAAPFDIDEFRIIKEAKIGTYQIFQETYHPEIYKRYHLGGRKKDYFWRLTALDRAQEAGIDDVGIGALFGLYDWRFEVLSLVRHTNHLEAVYNVGPHTISFPRLKKASKVNLRDKYHVSDEDFTRLIAILRLAVPYTGLILTARESARVRDEVIRFGVSQIDGGTKIELGGYSKGLSRNEEQDLNREQFYISDTRSLSEIMDELIEKGFLPSFCTACYRKGRTGEHFMEFSVPGFIKRFCTPNAILTFAEYLCDYADPELARKGWESIQNELNKLKNEGYKIDDLQQRLERIKQGARDLYY